jgi:hypothetical protein
VSPRHVSLLDEAEGDVGEHGRKDTALRRASVTAHEVTFGEDACLEECNDQAVHLRIIDTSANSLHQAVMRDVVETPLISPSTIH